MIIQLLLTNLSGFGICLFTFSFKPWSFQIKLKKALLKRRWEEGRLKSNGSRTPQIGKSPSANAATVC